VLGQQAYPDIGQSVVLAVDDARKVRSQAAFGPGEKRFRPIQSKIENPKTPG
jgi:hypothetical protein